MRNQNVLSILNLPIPSTNYHTSILSIFYHPSSTIYISALKDIGSNIHWIIEKAREFQKNIYLCFIDSTKAFDCVDHNKLWKILKEMGIPDHLTCLLRNLYARQEATGRTGHGTADWIQIRKRSMSRLYIVTLLV